MTIDNRAEMSRRWKAPNYLRWYLFRTVHTLLVVAVVAVLFTGIIPEAPTKHTKAASATSVPISHVVFIVKENRSFDSMFGTFPGVDGATTYTDATGHVLPLNHQPDHLISDIDHSHAGYLKALDKGKLDKFSTLAGAIQNKVDEADSQFTQADIPNYWSYAKTFTIADKFFSAVAGPTFPNHLFTIAGEDANVDTIPKTGSGLPWGCDTPAGITVEQRFPDGSTKQVAPCFDFPTLADVLDPAGISWKY